MVRVGRRAVSSLVVSFSDIRWGGGYFRIMQLLSVHTVLCTSLSFLPAAKPSRSRSGESPSPPEKSRIEYFRDLIPTVSMVIGPTKFTGGLKLETRNCSGPSRGATSATFLWWKAVEGRKSHHRGS